MSCRSWWVPDEKGLPGKDAMPVDGLKLQVVKAIGKSRLPLGENFGGYAERGELIDVLRDDDGGKVGKELPPRRAALQHGKLKRAFNSSDEACVLLFANLPGELAGSPRLTGRPSRTRAGAAPLKQQSTMQRTARALLDWKRAANSSIGSVVSPGESRSVS
jgi:hypothetical protein